MSEPYTGQVTAFAFPFAPIYWAFCDGSNLPMNQYGALFSLIGFTFGGDGMSKFGVPNLGGTSPCGTGAGPGLSQRQLGAAFGTMQVTLDQTTMAPHSHNANAAAVSRATPRVPVPTALSALTPASAGTPYTQGPADSIMSGMAVSPAGQSGPHNNMQPYIVLNYCIATNGTYPEFDT